MAVQLAVRGAKRRANRVRRSTQVRAQPEGVSADMRRPKKTESECVREMQTVRVTIAAEGSARQCEGIAVAERERYSAAGRNGNRRRQGAYVFRSVRMRVACGARACGTPAKAQCAARWRRAQRSLGAARQASGSRCAKTRKTSPAENACAAKYFRCACADAAS